MNMDTWLQQRGALLLLIAVMIGALGSIFDREWRDGEVFSPADLVFQFHPWAYDAPRQTGTNPTRSDEAFYHQPLMETHFSRLRAGHLPDHDPRRLAGVPSFFQGLDTGRMFSPFSLPFYASPADQAVSVYGPLRLLVAALCMWLFLRSLGLPAAAAALGGVAYGLNGHFLTWLSAPMPTVAAWLPLALLFVRRTVRATRWADASGLAVAIGLMAFGAYLATFLVCLTAVGLFAAVELAGTRRWLAAPWLAGGLAAGLLLGAAALGPMLGALLTSPAMARVAAAEGANWPNLATLAMPDFWGSPVPGTWWHPDPHANYPERVTYLGVAVIALAGAGVATLGPLRFAPVGWAAAMLVLLSLTRAYGVPPGRWLTLLPGQAQSNPFRWYAAAACGVAILAALGLHALQGGEKDRRPAWRALAGLVLVLLLLALCSGAALFEYLPTIRSMNLQPLLKAQATRFLVIGGLTAALAVLVALVRDARVRAIAAAALVVVAAADLAQANRRFNPTVPHDQYYPPTAGLAWLADQALGTRVAPVDAEADLIEGDVWSLYGIDTVTGFDFQGEAGYQQFLHAAQHPRHADAGTPAGADGPPPADVPPTVWGFVGLRTATLDLRLLGVLGVRYIVTSPLDLTPGAGGYATVGELTDGRDVRLRFSPRFDGLRRVDLLSATHRRENVGRLRVTLADSEGRIVADRDVDARDLPDNDWLTLTFPPVMPSAGQAFELRVTAHGTAPDRSPTLWATAGDPGIDVALTVDGQPRPGSLWFRAYSSAPERVPGATLAYADDLNAYRNPHGRPHAWFVERVRIGTFDGHLSGMQAEHFDPVREAWLTDATLAAPTPTARVTAVEIGDDVRHYAVEAPDGGVLVLRERAHAGWHV
jgi:hypothetical protein